MAYNQGYEINQLLSGTILPVAFQPTFNGLDGGWPYTF